MIPLRLSIREMQRRPLRALLTLGSVVIGVAAIVSVAMTTSASKEAQRSLTQAVTGKSQLEITADGGGLFDPEFVDNVQKVRGVESVAASLRRFVILQLPDDRKSRVQVVGVEPAFYQQLQAMDMKRGRLVEARDEVVLDESFARSLRIELDQEVRFLTSTGFRTARVVGLSSPKNAQSVLQGSVAWVSFETAQAWFRGRGRADIVQVILADKVKVADVQSAIERSLPEGISVRPPSMTSRSAEEMMVGIKQGLALATIFSIIIAVFIIYNTFQMNVSERRRQFGILRAIGTSRKDIILTVLREGLVLGTAGIAVGWGLGIAGAYYLSRAMEQVLGVDLPKNQVSIVALIGSAVCGYLIMIVGVMVPARKAGKLTPSEAMRIISTAEFEKPSRRMAIVGAIAAILGLLTLLGCVAGVFPILISNTCAITCMIGCLCVLPFCLERILDGLVRTFGRPLGVIGVMAKRQLLRHPSRTTLTIGVLFMAIGTGLAMSNTILDNIADIRRWYQRAIVGDFFIRAAMPDMATGQAAEMPEDLQKRLDGISGIERVDTLTFASARCGDSTVYVVARDFRDDAQVYFDLQDGDEDEVVADVRQGGVVVSSVLAHRNRLKLHDELPLATNHGTQTFPIVGICNDYLAGGLSVYMNRQDAEHYLGLQGISALIIQSKSERSSEVETALRQLCDETGLMLQSYRELVTFIENVTNGVVASLWIVLTLGSLIAAFGLMNTLAMSIQEQTREIGMLRVVAMTRGQIRAMVVSQAAMMALIAIVPGVPAGLVIAYLVNLSTKPVTGHAVAFGWHPEVVVGTAAIGFAVILLAALAPSERAVRLRLSDALQYE